MPNKHQSLDKLAAFELAERRFWGEVDEAHAAAMVTIKRDPRRLPWVVGTLRKAYRCARERRDLLNPFTYPTGSGR